MISLYIYILFYKIKSIFNYITKTSNVFVIYGINMISFLKNNSSAVGQGEGDAFMSKKRYLSYTEYLSIRESSRQNLKESYPDVSDDILNEVVDMKLENISRLLNIQFTNSDSSKVISLTNSDIDMLNKYIENSNTGWGLQLFELEKTPKKNGTFLFENISTENYDIFFNLNAEIYLFLSIFIVFCYSLFNSKREKYKYPLMQTNTIYMSILVILLTIFIYNSLFSNIETNIFHLYQNDLFVILKQTLLFIIMVIFLLSINYVKSDATKNVVSYEFSILLLLSVWSMCVLLSASDLISIYLLIELQSFCFYIMTAAKSNSNFSTEAGLKYFILGSFSSGLLLFGISILYGFTGLTNLEELKVFFYSNNIFNFNNLNDITDINGLAIIFSLILIIIGILFKFGLVPFHMYVPDVYTGAPTIVTTLFLVTQKFVILIVYINLYNALFCYYFNNINYFIIISIIASIVLGSITALAQSKIKRLVAYSAIVNGGYLLLGVAVGTVDGLSSSLLFLYIYITLIVVIFTIYMSTKNQYNDIKLAGFKDFILLKKGNLILAMIFSLSLFSIAGIPPLAGFYGKLFLFTSVIKEGSYALAIVAILFTVVTAYYYIRLIKIMFFEKTLKFGFFNQVTKIDAYIISVGTLFNLIFFAMPKLFFVFFNTILLKFYFFL